MTRRRRKKLFKLTRRLSLAHPEAYGIYWHTISRYDELAHWEGCEGAEYSAILYAAYIRYCCLPWRIGFTRKFVEEHYIQIDRLRDFIKSRFNVDVIVK